MIKNDADYTEALSRLKEFQERYSEKAFAESAAKDPEATEIERSFAQAKLRDWQEQIDEYERLARGDCSGLPPLDCVFDLAHLIVKWRIARGWSLMELAARLEEDWQELECLELNDFEDAPFHLLLRICHVLKEARQ